MWLWILSILFLSLVWGIWFLLIPTEPQSEDIFPLWIPLVATAIVVLILGTLFLVRRIRAIRAARALEKAIAQQAQEQALNARPEDRAEIQALHKQFQEGIEALKRSKLGSGKSGERALYELPWYVIVGPPGAGKTTALRHSGLSFPFLDPSGGGVRGVGGTRNCDWWFTNEAILLDTAGRYTTEEADHDEWIGFLEQLLKYRYHKPINGVLVAVSVSDLLDASDEQIQEMASKIRSRVDEMQVHLKMIVPVYITFTKIDLVAGFVEFFGDLKKSERSQAWGATFRLDADKSAPGKIFDTEFDLLVQRLHMRGLRRMTLERSRGTKEKVYQFPLEFAAIKRNLSDFLQAAFAPGAAGASAPVLRGFYFTSGTQEGKPLDRIVGAMGRAYGLKVAEPEESDTPKEAKSYFLKDVFTNIIFPDQDVAARTEAEIRRRRQQRLLGAAAAIAVGILFASPAVISFANNSDLVAETDAITSEAGEINWNDSKGTLGKIDKLQKLREHTEKLDRWSEDGPPFAYGWMMYQGDKLFEPTRAQYLSALDRGFVGPVKTKLEAKLKGTTGAKYINDYNNLKTYILLNDREHLEEHWEWQIGRLTGVWAEVLRETSDAGGDLSEADLKYLLEPHVAYWVDLQRRGKIPNPPQTEPAVIEKTRDILTRVGPLQALYERFVTVLIDQKYDEAGAATPDNLRYPPVTLADAFVDRQEVLSVLRSRTKERDGKWFEVQGPYTVRGHEQVLKSLKDGESLLDREKWVVPLTQEEKLRGDRIKRELERVRQDYDQEYIRQWVEFFRDIDTATPITNRDAIAEYRVLTAPDWPYKRLLQVLSDNTQFTRPKSKVPGQQDGGVIDQIRTRVAIRVEARLLGVRLSDLKLGGGGERYDPVPDKFRSMVEFGVTPPPPPAEGAAAPPPAPDPQLNAYVADLEKLESEMSLVEEGPANTDSKNATKLFTEAVKNTEAKIQTIDPTGRELLSPLLLNPLRAGYKAVIRNAGGAASGLWEVEVWPSYRDKIKSRYPFNLQASKDASYDDFLAFFAPKEGTLWGFYEAHLKDLHLQQEHDFVPQPQLEGSPKPAKPFTPFSPLLYNCLKRSHEITDAIWPKGAVAPQVDFFINLKTVSPIVSTVELVIDGQERIYKNEKEFWHKFKWPGAGEKGARMTVRGAGGLEESITRDGPWGMFRLFESADEITAVKDKDDQFIVTWQMTAPPVTVTMQVRPTRSNQPFPISFFRGMNCPPSIGDKLGK